VTNVIDPRAMHVNDECSGDLARVIGRAAYVFDLGLWRQRWRKAVEEDDYSEMDRLDRSFEMIGLP
jgi:hypothetical protein